MPFETREGQGALFTNDRKEPGSQQPDYRGNLRIGGVLYRISGWRKDSSGKRWLSLNIQPDQRQEATQKTAENAKPGTDPEFDDDIPF